MTARVRLYGYGGSEGSFTQVTRGMRRALAAADELAGECYLDGYADDSGGELAPVSLNLGDPTALLRAHRDGDHKSHWLLLAPNSETLPHGFMDGLRKPSDILPRGMLTGGLLTPSAWAASVLRRYVPDEVPVIVAPHGVTPEIHVMNHTRRLLVWEEWKMEQFRVLHMTSSETERKGTKLLLRAWGIAKRTKVLPPLAKLHVVMNPLHMSKIHWWCADLGLTDADVITEPGLTLSQNGMAGLYSSMHMVCQPSRGEGFGLVPLEALACGVPIIATACTGHAEFLGNRPPGAVIVSGSNDWELAPMDDFPGSMAPKVTVEAIVEALGIAYPRWEMLTSSAEQNAERLRHEWAWEKKNSVPIKQMLQSAEWQIKEDS